VTNLSRKYQTLLEAVAPELLLATTELGILQTLETEKRAMYAGDIASELDKSYRPSLATVMVPKPCISRRPTCRAFFNRLASHTKLSSLSR